MRSNSMQGLLKSFTVAILLAALIALPTGYLSAAACNPDSVTLCVAIDDIADVWINNNYAGQFNYVNWDQTGVYPTCITIPASWLEPEPTLNYISISVMNTECCQIWGSWSIESSCTGAEAGKHSCLSSDDADMRIFAAATPNATPPPLDGALTWWNKSYTLASAWPTAIVDTGLIYGKLIYNPCTGTRLQPLSYSSQGVAETYGQSIFMRQPFGMTPVPTMPPPSFTISKSITGAATNINTNDRVTYQLLVCNSGEAEPGTVILTDDFDNRFDFDGPYGGDCTGYGDGSPCNQWGIGSFTTRWMRGFPGNTCMTVTGKVVDWWVDSSEWCTTRANWAGVHWPSGDFTPNITPDAGSNTVSVTMYGVCGTNTFSPTITQTKTVTYTLTVTSTKSMTQTITPTSTRSRIPTYTNSPTAYPTNFTVTVTNTITITPSFTRTFTPTFTPTFTITMTWINAIVLVKSENCYVNSTYTPSPWNCEVPLGETVRYCIAFENRGLNPATFEIWDTIPGPMDFIWASQDSTGDATITTFNSGACLDYKGSPVNACRVLSWRMVNVPAGASGSVCFLVLVARLQTVKWLSPVSEYFADLFDNFKKVLYSQNTAQRSTQNLRNIRGPDKTD